MIPYSSTPTPVYAVCGRLVVLDVCGATHPITPHDLDPAALDPYAVHASLTLVTSANSDTTRQLAALNEEVAKLKKDLADFMLAAEPLRKELEKYNQHKLTYQELLESVTEKPVTL